MTKEEVIIRGVCGNRRSFTTFSVVLIRADVGRLYRLDINRVKGKELYEGDDSVLPLIKLIAEEAKSRIGETSAILRHKYADCKYPDFRTIHTIKPQSPDRACPRTCWADSIWNIPIPD